MSIDTLQTRADDALVKISANLPNQTVETLKSVAKMRGTTMTEVIRHAISLEKFFADVEREGSKVLLEKSDGKIVQLLNVA